MYLASLPLCFFLGFISLSLEMYWFSVFYYVSQGKAGAFGLTLSFVLFGIAYGARCSHRFLNKCGTNSLLFVAHAFKAVAIINFLTLPVFSYLMTLHYICILFFFLCVFFTSFILGMVFPILCGYGVVEKHALGEKISWLYFFNILGAACGPIITGYFFLDSLGKYYTSLLFSLLLLSVSGILYVASTSSNARKYKPIGSVCLLMLAIIVLFPLLYDSLIDKLHFREKYNADSRLKQIIETRSGIITVEPHDLGDIVYGDGAYDGRLNINPVINSNLIDRAYFIMAYHHNPADVLEIGLSSGSWLKVILSFPQVNHVDVVEINQGYIELISKRPLVKDTLTDARVNIHIDDGRRWLKNNSSRRYDLIIMNASFHWRENITHILSREFIRLLREHLKPGGLIYLNTTGSEAVMTTVASEFKYWATFRNFIAASNTPFIDKPSAMKKRLMTLPASITRIQGIDEVFDRLSMRVQSVNNINRLSNNHLIITDNNMLTEYKLISMPFIRKLNMTLKRIWEGLFQVSGEMNE